MSIYNFFTLPKQSAAAFGSDYLRKNFFNFLVLVFFLNWSLVSARGYEKVAEPEINGPNIKTVKFHRQGWPMSYPFIELNAGQKLFLSFDELGTEIKNYYYTVEYCDSDWSPSVLMPTEYFRGNDMIPVENFQRSFNTTFDYVHYELSLPNEEITLLLSGNYLLKVFEAGHQDQPALTRRFYVTEQSVSIEAEIKYTMLSSGRSSYQEVDFKVYHPGLTIMDPSSEVSVTIRQNGRTDNAITGLRPLFFGNDVMDFNYNREVVFEGGNEFRWVDLRSYRFQSDHVRDITFSDPFYHIQVFTDESHQEKSYYYHDDFNGRYYIDVQEEGDPSVSADYAFVHFSLSWQPPLNNTHVYLTGALNNWMLDAGSRMIYSAEDDLYHLTLLLKQGYYNYQYVVENGEGGKSVAPVEGSFGRAENDYLILVYYKPTGQRYDRLIGLTVTNSVNKVN
ncbi:type IX secretion system plug protein [Thermophagus sp. OGC60D27]|uniref:type IX secretion system plug protein n=1 Tax=Thermophagus sp. OGC60D27 TaxID=3458415 RepID=UPI004037DB21